MQAIILAAGSAQRMRPLSDGCHKAMLPVGGSTILARIVEGLIGIGVTTITVVTGYREAEIRDYLEQSCPGPEYRFVDNPAYGTTNNIVSLLLGLQSLELDDDVVLVECDLLLSPGLLERLAGPDRGNIALVDRYRTGMDGTVVHVRDGLLSRVIPPDAQGDDFEYRGTFKTLNVYRFSRGFCDELLTPLLARHVAHVDDGCYYEVVLARLGDLTEHAIHAEVVDGQRWAEVDDPHDLEAARFLFQPDERAAIIDRSRGGHWGLELVDFSYIRNAYFPPEAMQAAMRHSLRALLEGYGSTQPLLDEKLAWFLRCAPSRLVALNGAAQAYPILRGIWSGRSVAVPEPTFGEYPRVFPDATTYADRPGDGLEDGALERLAAQVDVLTVVNPNNPTGTTVPTAELYDLAAAHPETTILVDESFLGFTDEPSMVQLLESAPLPNVVVLCSLSKTLGVPGLRIGYLYGCEPAFTDAVRREIPIWNMNAIAEYFVELLLKFRPQLEASLEQTKRDRAAMAGDLRELAVVADVQQGGGNFVLVRLHGPAAVAEHLRHALLAHESTDIKDVSGKFGDGAAWIRLAVRLPEENRTLIAAIGRHTSVALSDARRA